MEVEEARKATKDEGMNATTTTKDNDDDEGPLKRRRLTYQREENVTADFDSDGGPSQQKLGPKNFLPFHLQVLKSLYQNDEETCVKQPSVSSYSASSSMKEAGDGPVEAEVWAMTLAFLQNRAHLLEAKKEASRWHGIQQEAVKELQQQQQQQQQMRTMEAGGIGQPITTIMTNRRSSFSPHKTAPWRQHSPLMLAHNHHHHHHMMSQQSHNNGAPITTNASSSSSFQIVAHLLGQRSEKAEAAFQQKTSAYKPLLTVVQDRIQKLQEQLELHKESLDESNQKILEDLLSSSSSSLSRSNNTNNNNLSSAQQTKQMTQQQQQRAIEHSQEEEQSRMAATACKIRLWNMLRQDLQQIV